VTISDESAESSNLPPWTVVVVMEDVTANAIKNERALEKESMMSCGEGEDSVFLSLIRDRTNLFGLIQYCKSFYARRCDAM